MRSLRFLIPAAILAVSLVGCNPATNTTPVPAAIVPVVVVPTVSSVVPAADATGVALNANLSVSFSVAMDPASITTANFTLKKGVVPVGGAVSNPTATTAMFNPTDDLDTGAVYTATLSTAVKSAAGVALAASYVWTITAGNSADTIPPTVTTVVPANAATGVALNTTVVANFGEDMAPATLVGANFTLNQGGTPVAGLVTSTGTSVTFTPGAALTNGLVYTATVTTNVKDLAGNALAVNKVWTFTTVAAANTGPVAVDLLSAKTFAVFGKSAVSNTTTSVITGDVGTFAAGSFLTGFDETVDGSGDFATSAQLVAGYRLYGYDYLHVTPAKVNTASNDSLTAYNDAAGRADAVELASGSLGGLNLGPGLYHFAGNVTIPTSVTLNGNANDVWIFQIGGTFAVTDGANVTLTGGALAKNVFWQVAGTAELGGSTSVFNGTVLGMTSITVITGGHVNGSLLAQTFVALQSATVTLP